VGEIMGREEYIKELIDKRGLTIKDFSKQANIPYTTLLSMLKDGALGGSSVDNVIKVCKTLEITIEELENQSKVKYKTSKELKEINFIFSKLKPKFQTYALSQLKGLLEIQD